MAKHHRLKINALRLAIVAGILLCWEYLPQIPWVKVNEPWSQPFFIRSPSLVAKEFYLLGISGQYLETGATYYVPVTLWNYYLRTFTETMLGFIIGVFAGLLIGLMLSRSKLLGDALTPLLNTYNAMPKIIIVPLIVLVLGAALLSMTVVAVITVFFTVFYNSFQGSKDLDPDIRIAYKILGASKLDMFLNVELPNTVSWVLASLPNAIAACFGIVLVAEILSGAPGLGLVLSDATDLLESDVAFVVILLIGATGVGMIFGINYLTKKIFPWLPQFRG